MQQARVAVISDPLRDENLNIRELVQKIACEKSIEAILPNNANRIKSISIDRTQSTLPVKTGENTLESLTLKFDNQFDCSICYEKCSLINGESFGCSHMFCKKCICQYLTTSIADGKTDSLKCPESGCDREATEKIVEKLVPFKVFERYYELRLKKAVGKMDDIFYCPNPECQAIVPCEIDVGLGICYECEFSFCTNCLKPFHGTIDCYLNEHERKEMLLRYQIQQQNENEDNARNLRIAEEQSKIREKDRKKRLEQDRASEKFIKKAYKKCPGCQLDVEKLDGCNHMTCTVCQTNFCWLCLIKFANNEVERHYSSKCKLFEYDYI